MNITLKRTEEQIELVKAMASKNREVAYEAQAALAEFIGPVLAEVINNAPVLSNLFKPLQYNADDNPSLPLDLYYDITADDYITVYSQSMPGGLPTNQVAPTATELKVATYSLDSAVSFDRRYAAKSRLDVVGKTFTRVAQEILLKQEKTSANLVLGTLADNTDENVLTSAAAGRFLLADLNSLLTQSKRLHASWSGGTPDRREDGLNVLMVSPEVVQDLRAMAYNPISTELNPAGPAATSAPGFVATDEVRNSLFNSSGEMPSFFGVDIMEVWQLGPNRQFTNIFYGLEGSTPRQDLVVALNTNRDSLVRVVAVDSESGSEFTLMADDQYSIRQQKIGYYGALEEGRVVLDRRVVLGTQV
tara:strand:+ start:354 stop:1436 length:1083 start_codon:yes stop_codon:yes gene_type:complete